ncbi:response regulator transcription factor [Acidisoma silvae]|uniref:Response regulator transcription factor n=1 Tax=Acidisoma silvae TaxID=2802396 RepID=A0A963YSV9_9PROT|nr:response regulator transcription factor [Acidisoma silvae]MCB8876412.1 response regulator transcription factor [Acidisoma silvae]
MKLLLIDDHPVVRQGLSAFLERNLEDASVFLAGSCEEALALAADHKDLDLAFLDLMMPGLGGFDAIKLFGSQYPALPVIVLSSSEDPLDVRRALACGALGYVPKSASPQTIVSALRLVLSGEIYVPPLVLLGAPGAGGGYPAKAGSASVDELTLRQKEVLVLLARGMQNKEIGESLGLADKTVKTHVTAIFRTLRVINRTQAASLAREAKLL